MSPQFPSLELFQQVCQKGLSSVRPLGPDAGSHDPYGWNFGSAQPPSYWAYGRLRALLMLQEATEVKPKRVLEVAAGDGSLSAVLQRLGCEVVANDLRRENLEAAISHFSNRESIQILAGNIFEVDPNETGKFDFIAACEIIEHVAHAVDFVQHLGKFLSPNGRLLLTTPNGAYFRSKLPTFSEITDFAALERAQFKPDADGHLYLITATELGQIATAAGFEVEKLVTWGTPFISGSVGMHKFSSLFPLKIWYGLELASQKLPEAILNRWANSLSAVLRPKQA